MFKCSEKEVVNDVAQIPTYFYSIIKTNSR